MWNSGILMIWFASESCLEQCSLHFGRRCFQICYFDLCFAVFLVNSPRYLLVWCFAVFLIDLRTLLKQILFRIGCGRCCFCSFAVVLSTCSWRGTYWAGIFPCCSCSFFGPIIFCLVQIWLFWNALCCIGRDLIICGLPLENYVCKGVWSYNLIYY